MRTVLITGANGLLGKDLCQNLILEGSKVYAMTHSIQGLRVPGVEYIEVDFTDEWNEELLPESVDVIIHLAQSEHFRDFPHSAIDVFKVNIESTMHLLNYAKKVNVKQFIYASSGGVYGNGAQAFNENSPIVAPGQLGFYLGSKTCGEILVQSYASVFQVVVLRPFFIYGAGQNRSMLIPRLMDNIASGIPVSLQGKQGIKINPIHVKDASKAIIATLKLKESATFNIAGPQVLSIREICEGMGAFLGVDPIFTKQAGKANDLIADISVMKKLLVSPQYYLFDCLEDI